MAKKTVRVQIPANPDDLLKLLKKVLAKHEADGADSQLKMLQMALLSTLTETADLANDEADRLYKQAEIKIKKRDATFGTAQTPDTALFILTQIRDLLLSIHKNNPQLLQDWGFEVVEGTSSRGKAKTS